MQGHSRFEYALFFMAVVATLVVITLAVYCYRNQKSWNEGHSESYQLLPQSRPRLFFSFSPTTNYIGFKRAHALQSQNRLANCTLYFEILLLEIPLSSHVRIGLCLKDNQSKDIRVFDQSSVAIDNLFGLITHGQTIQAPCGFKKGDIIGTQLVIHHDLTEVVFLHNGRPISTIPLFLPVNSLFPTIYATKGVLLQYNFGTLEFVYGTLAIDIPPPYTPSPELP
ncbi:hypothetical protein DSO57_1033600 [Entomophthora muscae]|uniref:Uncharacterized protein n=1 Tax=Entomophthora muscae TaxID=34485 RepID=A0ACC2TAY7_9FUNG|nr:hypothetical protein DSO57_1033600 [Entomophthora muscae]